MANLHRPVLPAPLGIQLAWHGLVTGSRNQPSALHARGRTASGAVPTFGACLQLRHSHHLPLRILRFLEDARAHEILRTVGPVYQFRHQAGQEVELFGTQVPRVVDLPRPRPSAGTINLAGLFSGWGAALALSRNPSALSC